MATLQAGSAETIERVDFTFATLSPTFLFNLSSGDEILNASVVVSTPFDDPTATLRVGTVADPDLIFAAGEVPTNSVGQATCFVAHEISTTEILRLLISPGLSTTGAGHVLFRIRR